MSLLESIVIDVIPTANPDGYASRVRNNARDVDLNRGFPDRFGTNGTMVRSPASEQPEVTALADLARDQPAVASAAMHEGALVANYPYDGTPDGTTRNEPCPDDAAFRSLARAYADAHPRMHLPSNAEFKATLGITNGAQWYPIYGSLQDYDYLAAGTFEITLELSEHKWPVTQLLPGLYAENEASMLALPRLALLGGVRGSVRATPSGDPAAAAPFASSAALRILLDDSPTRSVYHTATGLFARPAAPGEHTLVVEAEGYAPHHETLVVPGDGSGVQVDVVLVPVAAQDGADAEPRVATGSETQAETNALASAEAEAKGDVHDQQPPAEAAAAAAAAVEAGAAAKAAKEASGQSAEADIDFSTSSTMAGSEPNATKPIANAADASKTPTTAPTATRAASAQSASAGAPLSLVGKLSKFLRSGKLESEDAAIDMVPLNASALSGALGRKGGQDADKGTATEGTADPAKADALRLADEASDAKTINNGTLLAAALARATAEDVAGAGSFRLSVAVLLVGGCIVVAALFFCVLSRRLRRRGRARRTGGRARN